MVRVVLPGRAALPAPAVRSRVFWASQHSPHPHVAPPCPCHSCSCRRLRASLARQGRRRRSARSGCTTPCRTLARPTLCSGGAPPALRHLAPGFCCVPGGGAELMQGEPRCRHVSVPSRHEERAEAGPDAEGCGVRASALELLAGVCAGDGWAAPRHRRLLTALHASPLGPPHAGVCTRTCWACATLTWPCSAPQVGTCCMGCTPLLAAWVHQPSPLPHLWWGHAHDPSTACGFASTRVPPPAAELSLLRIALGESLRPRFNPATPAPCRRAQLPGRRRSIPALLPHPRRVCPAQVCARPAGRAERAGGGARQVRSRGASFKRACEAMRHA